MGFTLFFLYFEGLEIEECLHLIRMNITLSPPFSLYIYEAWVYYVNGLSHRYLPLNLTLKMRFERLASVQIHGGGGGSDETVAMW